MKHCSIVLTEGCDCGKTVCCHHCESFKTCKSACDREEDCKEAVEITEETALQAFMQNSKALTVMKKIAELKLEKDAIEAKDKEVRNQLTNLMDSYGIKSFDNDILKVTHIAESTTTSIDTTKLKKEMPDIAQKYTTTKKKSGYVRIDVK